jgi:hypothetical protein
MPLRDLLPTITEPQLELVYAAPRVALAGLSPAAEEVAFDHYASEIEAVAPGLEVLTKKVARRSGERPGQPRYHRMHQGSILAGWAIATVCRDHISAGLLDIDPEAAELAVKTVSPRPGDSDFKTAAWMQALSTHLSRDLPRLAQLPEMIGSSSAGSAIAGMYRRWGALTTVGALNVLAYTEPPGSSS